VIQQKLLQVTPVPTTAAFISSCPSEANKTKAQVFVTARSALEQRFQTIEFVHQGGNSFFSRQSG
jgi:hypothetical protein